MCIINYLHLVKNPLEEYMKLKIELMTPVTPDDINNKVSILKKE
jgi:hypothetical protein